MTQSEFGWRQSILDLLREIASEVPKSSMADFLCEWFDDLYLPGFDASLYIPEAYARGLSNFASCFSPRELEAMQKFHSVFDGCTDSVPDDLHGIEFLKNTEWQKIRVAALIALRDFEAR